MTGVGGRVIDEDMSATEFASLVAACDVYVSLHRSEGFGLGMVEAMGLGKAVIATAYSGSGDFLTHRTGFPVSYRLVPVRPGDLYLSPGLLVASFHVSTGQPPMWAEPDLDDAANQIAHLHERADVRGHVGLEGRAFVTSRYSPAAHARVLNSVLEQYA